MRAGERRYRCGVSIYSIALIASGALATIAVGMASHAAHGPELIDRMMQDANTAREAAGGSAVTLSFLTSEGWRTRHVTLSGGSGLPEPQRARIAAAVGRIAGIGGVQWAVEAGQARRPRLVNCQEDVEAILGARTIRFGEASAAIDPSSQQVLDEVAGALRPCLGSIIAVTGHTDGGGEPDANLALSRARAESVRWALIGRGIPADGLRATGKGSTEPVEGLDPADPANRRIEFSVIETVPIKPTPIDTPGPG